MKYIKYLIPIIMLSIASSGYADPTFNVRADTISFQNGVTPTAAYDGCEDTMLNGFAIGNNYGLAQHYYDDTNGWGTGADTAGHFALWEGGSASLLIKFSGLDAIPDNADILYAELTINGNPYFSGAAAACSTVIGVKLQEQRWIEEQVWNQLRIKINLVPPVTLLDNLQTDEAKDANQGLEIQPNDVTAGNNTGVQNAGSI